MPAIVSPAQLRLLMSDASPLSDSEKEKLKRELRTGKVRLRK